MSWNDLTLMLRTGFSDDEVIAAAIGKQLTAVIGTTEERLLRNMGAGNRLIGYLRNQRVYDEPPMVAPTRNDNDAPTRTIASPQAVYVPVATPFPTIDYAARDRQVAYLKKRIDELDEKMRVVRTNPRDSRYWYCYAGPYGRVDQLRYDAFMKRIDDERNDLRRQKWQLEGR